ncbi:3-deoxy-D-manno-octulosonic acid transferase [Halomonas sp. ZH2S]|uniref:3-deoxy-D-manno-octulosonic acid transferase n=1 Tax=Vreelandella zhuhanensis TaxID=2684210 RepID=A0A7X3KSN7_9GAMM|nr:lipid IV(A) 3-deoxy-D-manno-octulosonic acid transferase [Halomonas zhuhanensis]MWJ29172.1 3-deoxy-D-manno-octulosonic acid transferase [Halomonas zhuhanensis]
MGLSKKLPRYLYSAALYALSPLIWWRIYREQVPTNSRWERLGFSPDLPADAPVIWLHCASVGEVRAARPLLEALLARYPAHRVLLTTMTATGAQQAQALIAGKGSSRLAHGFLPLDFPGAARRFVRRVRPVLALMFETELWPNLLDACHRRKVPVAVVNGRLSPGAFSRYQRIRPLLSTALQQVTWLAAKSEADAERFRALGMVQDKTTVIGSLKFDMPSQDKALKEGEHLRHGFGKRPVWVAGSTRDGEEKLLLVAHRQLRQKLPEALLILVPRHPQRFEEVARLCESFGLSTVRRSRNQAVQPHTAVYLGDTLGELAMLYAAGDMAFVGGSLVPLGGHNVLEPAALGLPVISGPSWENFEDVAPLLYQAGALTRVENSQSLSEALYQLACQPALRQQQGDTAQNVVKAHQGALQRTLDGLERLLPATVSQLGSSEPT